ncbi:MAG: putative protein YqeY [Ignavibacteriaceae bacterium]|nr:putative protein YqeY [Ignavibacteriaceae bacterium]
MSDLLGKLEQDLLTAMKAKEGDKVDVLRMVKAAVLNYKIDKKKEILTDQEVHEILQKQAKQRRESIDSFEKAGRTDLAAKEKKEVEILQAYLPKQLSDDEIKTFAQQAIAKSGAKSKAEIGLVMKELMPMVKGKADGKKVNEILASLLA